MPRISEIDPFTLRVPVAKPNAAPKDKYIAGVLVHVEGGDVGTGLTGMRSLPFNPFEGVIADVLRDTLVGAEALEVRRLWRHLADSKLRQAGEDGHVTAARAAVDIALWDLAARAAGWPLHALLGTDKSDGELWTYVTAGDPDWSDERVLEAVTQLVDEGWRSIKVKVGQPDPLADARRLSRIREQVGDDLRLMVDATGLWRYEQAATFCAAAKHCGIAWLEEPCAALDVDAHARLARATAIPIAIGESIASPLVLRDFLVAGAAHVVQADVTRVGGITPWLGIAGLVEAFGAVLVPHHSEFGQVQQHCAFATRSAVALEFPWPADIFEEPVVRDGQTIRRPSAPGASTRLKQLALDELRLT